MDESLNLTTTRSMAAPLAAVWAAWTDPTAIARWWGPAGFGSTVNELDVRDGGRFDVVMHGPDGTDFANVYVFNRVREQRQIVFTHLGSERFGLAPYQAVVDMAGDGGRTRVVMTATYASSEEKRKHVETFGAVDGSRQLLERWEEEARRIAQASPNASTRVAEVSDALTRLAHDAEARFGKLSAARLNWKPGHGAWSVAQCFDHLITTQTHYFPVLERLASGPVSPSVWERYSPFSRFFGRFLIRTLDPANARKTKTVSKSQPSASDLRGDVISRFAEHQRDLVGRLRALPTDLDLERVIITSPLSSVVTYSLDDCLTILVVHGRRHLGQAERVTTATGFPS